MSQNSQPAVRRFVVMGVSGCGKTTVGAAVAQRLDALFVDGDDLHSQNNIEKMARGQPLTDADRHPWLVDVGRQLAKETGPIVIGCSALKRSYRDTICKTAGGKVWFLYLDGSRDVLLARMTTRSQHFMPASLLESQLVALEPPQPDELSVCVDIDQPVDRLVDQLVAKITAA
ncbi:MAG: gluconokinase [Marinosulfonomonas sp.]|nr:gluconokinase [Marinosulfonomonas sp.]